MVVAKMLLFFFIALKPDTKVYEPEIRALLEDAVASDAGADPREDKVDSDQ